MRKNKIHRMNKLGAYIGGYTPQDGIVISLKENHILPKQGQKVLVVHQLSDQLTSSIDGKKIGCEEIVIGSGTVTRVDKTRANIRVLVNKSKRGILANEPSNDRGRIIIKEIF